MVDVYNRNSYRTDNSFIFFNVNDLMYKWFKKPKIKSNLYKTQKTRLQQNGVGENGRKKRLRCRTIIRMEQGKIL